MIKNNEPYLIEYNVRMGDPECQTILPLLKNDLLDTIIKCVDGKLNEIEINWTNKKSICIVVTSKGYPGEFKKNVMIKNLENLKSNENQYIFHAGTKFTDNKYFSSGGRVLNFVSMNEDFKLARNNSIKLIETLKWENGFYRKDIGFKVID